MTQITWFPAGAQRNGGRDTRIPVRRSRPNTKITLTFSKPVEKVLGHATAAGLAATHRAAGSKLNSHTIEFVPQGYGYGLGADVRVSLPAGVNLVGGHEQGCGPRWPVDGPRRLDARAAATARTTRLSAGHFHPDNRQR